MCFRNHCELMLTAGRRGASPYILTEDVLYRLQDQRMELFNGRTGKGVVLEDVGADIVRGLLTLPGKGAVVDYLCGTYEVAEAMAAKDVDRIAGELTKSGFLEARQSTVSVESPIV